MRGGSGIDGLIHNLAGELLVKELRVVAPNGADTGVPVVTRAYNLPQKFVIHVAGPDCRNLNTCAPEQLTVSYYNSLKAASELGLESIGLCSISTGIYRYPLSDAAPRAIETAITFLADCPNTSLRRIVFAMWAEGEHAAFEHALREAEKARNGHVELNERPG